MSTLFYESQSQLTVYFSFLHKSNHLNTTTVKIQPAGRDERIFNFNLTLDVVRHALDIEKFKFVIFFLFSIRFAI